MKNKLYIAGNGNVSSELCREFSRHRIEVAGIYSRNATKAPDNIAKICKYGVDKPEEDSIVFITVPDRYIAEVERAIGVGKHYTVHTAGSISIDVLNSPRKGVFYPLQTFSTGIRVSWENMPVFIETNDEELLEALFEISAAFGARGIEADSEQRASVHLAAVFANNFSNAMFDIAEKLVRESGLQVDILLPLIYQTVKKLELLHASDAQTGPAKRGDADTIALHLKSLEYKPEFRSVYEAVSNYILSGLKK